MICSDIPSSDTSPQDIPRPIEPSRQENPSPHGLFDFPKALASHERIGIICSITPDALNTGDGKSPIVAEYLFALSEPPIIRATERPAMEAVGSRDIAPPLPELDQKKCP
jgi:hypothetical protein